MERNEIIALVADEVGKSAKYIKGIINKAYKVKKEELGGIASDEAIFKLSILEATERYDFMKGDLDTIIDGDGEEEEEEEYDDEDEDYEEEEEEEDDDEDDEEYDDDDEDEEYDEDDYDDDEDEDDEEETIQDFWDKIDEEAVIAKSNQEYEKTPAIIIQAGVRYTFEFPDPTKPPFKWYDTKWKKDKYIWKILLKGVFPREALREFNTECEDKDKKYKIDKKFSWFQTELCYAIFKIFVKKFGKDMIPPKRFTFKDTGKNNATRYKFATIKKSKPKPKTKKKAPTKKKPVKKKSKR